MVRNSGTYVLNLGVVSSTSIIVGSTKIEVDAVVVLYLIARQSQIDTIQVVKKLTAIVSRHSVSVGDNGGGKVNCWSVRM